MRQKKIIVMIVGSLCLTSLYAGENVYLGETFNQRHSTINESFVKTTVKSTQESDSYTQISGKEELREAILSGELDQEVSGNKINKEYRYIDIKNANINQNDLKDMQGDEVLIGSRITDEKQSIEQYISIKNSNIKADKNINVGVISTSEDTSGITSLNTIEKSSLIGGNKLGKRNSSAGKIDLDMDREEQKSSISLID